MAGILQRVGGGKYAVAQRFRLLHAEEPKRGIDCAGELIQSLPRLFQRATRLAYVEDDANGERCFVVEQLRNVLFDAVFEKLEMFFLKTGDEAVQRVGYGNV